MDTSRYIIYFSNANPNDIALIQLNGSMVFNERVQQISLPDANSEIVGEGVISGWGYTGGNLFPHTPNTLQYEEAAIIDNQQCMEKLADKFHGLRNPFNVTTNICSDNPEANHGICNGDSGGPLVHDGKLIGVSSWGFKPCGQKAAPSVFTKVSNYIHWIRKQMNTSN
ncbi:hypothetical protein JTB14_035490 [Gonioctena quinquepunctata]|nr:hypothetical protein JTB14_035490 [Gonioctena quinquepunctata]